MKEAEKHLLILLFVSLPAYTANLLHQLSTTKNGATYQPINTRVTGQKKLYQPGQILAPPFCFICHEWVTSTTFQYMWTTYLDVYLFKCISKWFFLNNGPTRILFCLFSFFSNINFTEKYCMLQRDSNSDHQNRRRAR